MWLCTTGKNPFETSFSKGKSYWPFNQVFVTRSGMDNRIVATLKASGPRRYFAVGCMAFVAGLLLYMVAKNPPADPGWLILLLIMAAGSAYFARRMWWATQFHVELTRDELRLTNGQRIASVNEINMVDRGIFAFKPSNGFSIRLDNSPGFLWYPGLVWRVGTLAGIGGVTGAGQGKAMADLLALILTGDLPDDK